MVADPGRWSQPDGDIGTHLQFIVTAPGSTGARYLGGDQVRVFPYIRFSILLLLTPVLVAPADGDPVSLTFTGRVPSIGGVPSYFVGPPVAIGDAFTVTLTYDPLSGLTGPAATVDTYENAVFGIVATFHTSTGPIIYSADRTLSPSTVNFGAVGANDVFFQVTDSDLDGSAPPVVGPDVNGMISGQPTAFVAEFLAIEFMGDFRTMLLTDSLPTPAQLRSQTILIRLSVGTRGPLPSGPGVVQANYEGLAVFPQEPVLVPEPASTPVLFGTGLAGLVAVRLRRR